MEAENSSLESDSFENRLNSFENKELSRITCNTLHERDAVLERMKANVGALNSVIESDDKVIYSRSTSKEHILVEDVLDRNNRSNVTWFIYRTDIENDN
jgi:hypothetical protein